jgi:hypothetical protein
MVSAGFSITRRISLAKSNLRMLSPGTPLSNQKTAFVLGFYASLTEKNAR